MGTEGSAVTVGEMAPDFTVLNDQDQRVSLSDFRGKPVILFFYPKDDTPGCTVEACSFRDALPRFAGLDAVVLGISPDSPKSHRKFKQKFELPYALLSDEGHAVSEQYGLWVEKTMWGRKYMGVARTTFVIDASGRIARIFEKVKPEEHAAEVAEAVAGLASRH
ncbi:MAG: bcp [Gemmatimonadetes bacterium]|nr:bcp [Gemmatimonadota bacterium]